MSLEAFNQAILTCIISYLQSRDAFNLSQVLVIPLTPLQLVMAIQNDINALYNDKPMHYTIPIHNTTSCLQLDIWKENYNSRNILVQLYINNQSSNVDLFPLVYLQQLARYTHNQLNKQDDDSKYISPWCCQYRSWPHSDITIECFGKGLTITHYDWYLSFTQDHIAIRTISCDNLYELTLIPSQELGAVITSSRYQISKELQPQSSHSQIKVRCMSQRSSCNIKSIKFNAYNTSQVYPLKIKYHDGLAVFTNESYRKHLDVVIVKNGSVMLAKSDDAAPMNRVELVIGTSLPAKTRMDHCFDCNHIAIAYKRDDVYDYKDYHHKALAELQKQHSNKQPVTQAILQQQLYIKLNQLIIQDNLNKPDILSFRSVGTWDNLVSIIANSSKPPLTIGELHLVYTPLANWSNVAAPVIDL
ncbi:Hypothetical protein MVR_LOCUS340 [uncultured virus]|nr:Hypothetical protein MVR_LOCUS340 [uncultured virus]